jgi:MFS superfamily sulfate permease-like transporter
MKTESKNKKWIPADGLAGLKENFSSDAMSGFLVFLLAMPLSLGIAKASNFPMFFGLVTAIIGGVVVSFFMGSRLSIKGPAAGLIVIASGAVVAFGDGAQGWHLALGAVVVAGLIQVLFGVFKLGKLADFFPSSAIHGMLAAIGIIIMSKQIHLLLGIDPTTLKGKETFELIAMIPNSIIHENTHMTEIGVACLLILILMGYTRNQKIKKIPAPLVVLLVAIPLGYVLHIKDEEEISNFALVKIGSISEAFKDGVINVDFSGILTHTGVFIQYVILFALIGSIESLLTAKAMDGLDPWKRKSDFNKDLIAVGIGNTLSGIVGGLPMISEVARSSANISNGARTRWANFFHGLFLLLALVFAVSLIEMIPNVALSAMLIFVGFKLTHPREYIHVSKIGKEQLLVFIATIIATLATDLLIGVGTGIVLEFIINFISGLKLKNTFKTTMNISNNENKLNVAVSGSLVFSNVLSMKKELNKIKQGQEIVIDASNARLIDHTSMVAIHDFIENYESGKVEFIGIDGHRAKGKVKTSSRVLK